MVPIFDEFETVPKETRDVITTVKGIRNISLDGLDAITADRFVETHKNKYQVVRGNLCGIISKEVLKCDITQLRYPLAEVTANELLRIRLSNIPTFIYKKGLPNGEVKYYAGKIPRSFSFAGSSLAGSHQCSRPGFGCMRLSASSDEKGGCQKVRDIDKALEKYPWIKEGYETINTPIDCFVVIRCKHNVPIKPHKYVPPKETPSKKYE